MSPKSPPKWLAGLPTRPCARCGQPCWSKMPTPLHRSCKPQGAPRSSVSWSERKRRAAAVSAHRAQYGDWCPGWGRAPHHVVAPNRLSADHVTSVYAGGAEAEAGELQVLCVRCNSSKRERSGRVAIKRKVEAPTTYPGPSRAWSTVYQASGTC